MRRWFGVGECRFDLVVIRADENAPPFEPCIRERLAFDILDDQLDRPQEARVYYQKALQIVPDEPSVLSNIGMSYLLTNELPQAEQYLKQAVSTRKADSRVRQNLALVVGLQGRFDEAERIASAEMSPSDAKANVEYLRQMLSQQNAWNILKEEDKKIN